MQRRARVGLWLRRDRDEKRLGARALGVRVELHHLDVPLDELWRRLEHRNRHPAPGIVPVTRDQLDRWAGFFQRPGDLERALFDPVGAHGEPDRCTGPPSTS